MLSAMVQEQSLHHEKLYLSFIDFRKAFDLIVLEILHRKVVKGKMLNAVQSVY